MSYQARFGHQPTPSSFESDLAPNDSSGDQELLSEADQVLTLSPALRRAKLVSKALDGAKVFWIDDAPEDNDWVVAMLRALGMTVVTVETTRSAIERLRRERFDVVISDIARLEGAAAGLDAMPAIRREAVSAEIIFYVGTVAVDADRPLGSRGITNQAG